MFKLNNTVNANYRYKFLVDNEYLYNSSDFKLTKSSIKNGDVVDTLQLDEKIDSVADNKNEIIIYFSGKSKRINKTSFSLINDPQYEALDVYHQLPYKTFQLVLVGEDILDRNCGLYNIETKKIEWVNESIFNPVLIDQYLFSNSISKAERFDLQTGSLIWSQSILVPGRYTEMASGGRRIIHDGEVDSFLGVYKSVLWLVLKNGLLLGLDVETGKILHTIGAPENYPAQAALMQDKKELNWFFHHHSVLDKEQGLIMKLFHAGYSDNHFNWYFETDLNCLRPQLSISKIVNNTSIDFEIDGNPCPQWPFDNDYVYLCNYRQYKIALFNRKTKSIDWVHQMQVDEKNKSFIIKMEVQGNRWYILDYSKTLYVYERE